MARVHCLDDYCPNLSVDGQLIEREETTRCLGTDLHQNLNWKNDSDSKTTSCYSTISVLKKLKHLAPFQLRKQLAESLILTKIDYNDAVTYLDLPQVDSLTNGTIYRHDKKLKRAKTSEINRINRAPKARASFEVPKAQEASRLVDLAGNQIALCHIGANSVIPKVVSDFEIAQQSMKHETFT